MAPLAIILMLAAGPVLAEPVSIAAIGISAAAAAGVGSAATIAAAIGVPTLAVTLGITVAAGLASIGVQMAFGGRQRAPRTPDLVRELAQPTSLPAYRFVYGRTRVFGTPAPFIAVGEVLYGALILNSRPSDGAALALFIDKLPLDLSGDPFDFTGGGAVPTNAPFAGFAQFWIGRGDQTAPPSAILAGGGQPFQTSDGWRGQTVLWCKLLAGPSSSRAERWRRVPPDIEVQMDFSRVWDPRDPAQSATDPTTWTHSRNRALIALDALMRNPVRPYPADQIDLPSFISAANSDDEAVALKAGGTEPRYRADGVIVWQGEEIEAQISPIVEAGAGRLVRSGGKVGITPGVWTEPVATVDDVLDDALSFDVLTPGRDLASVVTCRYVSPARGYEMADLAPYEVPGAEAEAAVLDMELPWVTSATQAMRVQKITALRQREQAKLQGTFPPGLLKAVSGSNVTVNLPAPYTPMNGAYEVQTLAPVTEMSGDGLAMRCPAELRGTSASVYAWTPADDEQGINDGVAVAARQPVAPPGAPLLLTTGAATALDTGDAVVPRLLVRWDQTESARATHYDVEVRAVGGDWQSVGAVPLDQIDGDGRVFVFSGAVSVGTSYDVRVRAVAPGALSVWIESGPITAAGPSVTLNAPTGGVATGGAGQISITFTAANDAEFLGIEFFGANTDDFSAATLIAGPIYGPANSVYGYTEEDLGDAVTRYYFARAVGPFGARSVPSASVSATTDP